MRHKPLLTAPMIEGVDEAAATEIDQPTQADERSQETGPVQLLVIGFNEPEFKGQIRAELDRLRESDVVRLIDAIVVQKDDQGNVERLQLSDYTTEEAQDLGAKAGALIGLGFGADEETMEAGALLGAAEGSDGHLLDANVWYVDDVIPNDSAAAIALVEHRWAIPLREAIWDAGGFHLADAWVHPEDLVTIGVRASQEIEAG
ncbi:MAG TPA: hypothetical protein VH760_11815 [Gaiellaceae bacterium]|jgi:uncharacterized membrane protein